MSAVFRSRLFLCRSEWRPRRSRPRHMSHRRQSQSRQFAKRVPQPPPVPVSPGAPLGSLGGYGSNVFGTGEYPARHQRGSQSAAQCAAPFPSTPARSALKPNPTIPQFRLKCAVSRSSGMALNAAEHIRITLDHGFGDGLHVLVIVTDGGDILLWSASSSSKLAAIAPRSARTRLRVSPFPASVYVFSQRNKT